MKDRDREDDRDRGRDREDRPYEENGAPNGDDRKGKRIPNLSNSSS